MRSKLYDLCFNSQIVCIQLCYYNNCERNTVNKKLMDQIKTGPLSSLGQQPYFLITLLVFIDCFMIVILVISLLNKNAMSFFKQYIISVLTWSILFRLFELVSLYLNFNPSSKSNKYVIVKSVI